MLRRLVRPMPRGCAFWHPYGLVATWGGVGLIRPAPGTWGSLAALALAVPLVWIGGPWLLAVALVGVTAVGIQAADWVGRSGEHDSPTIVVDEVAGQWLTLLPVCLDLSYYLPAFILFRIADIAKPWPASWIDRHLQSGLGVMLDDIAAALYAGAAALALKLLIG